MSKEPTAMTPLKKLSRKDGNPHHKTLLRQIRNFWTPASVGEAKWFAEECYGRTVVRKPWPVSSANIRGTTGKSLVVISERRWRCSMTSSTSAMACSNGGTTKTR